MIIDVDDRAIFRGAFAMIRMKRIQTALFVAAAALFLLAGQGCNHSVVTVAEYKVGGAATFGEAPIDGTYELFGNGGSRKAVYELTKGDNVGFRPGDNGKIIAVAGPDEVELPEGYYYWQVKK